MKKSSEYVKNTIILLAGKFSTQFISILLVPIYTYFLNPTDYGTVDLLQTYITLFMRVFLLRIDYAAFRYLIDERKNEQMQNEVITNIVITLLIEIVIVSIFSIILKPIIKIQYYNLVIINIITLMLSNTLLQILRGKGDLKAYSISCILTAIVSLIVNVISIILFNRGASSILVATIFSNIICSIYILIKSKILKNINMKYFNKEQIMELLKYSIPLIPNALSWWIVNVSDRTIIVYFINTAANGIYSVSCKFSNILNSIFSIFSMSWQETASLHINDEDNKEFFSKMINDIFFMFATISLLIIVFMPFVFEIFIGKDYVEAYKYIPLILFGNLFSVLTSLIGGIYIAKKMSKEIAKTTILSAVINIVINVIFIKKIGLYAATISTIIAYFSMFLYRYIDVQKYLKIKLDLKRVIQYTVIFLICCFIYYKNEIHFNFIGVIIAIFYGVVFNKNMIKYAIDSAKKYIMKKRNEKV